jgi:hypothetical protein
MPAAPSDFHEPCRWCGQPCGTLASGGLGACPEHDLAAALCGACPAGTSPEDYRWTVLALAVVTRQLPQGRTETWAAYKLRASMAFAEWQAMRPIPPRLKVPLPAAAIAIAERGQTLHDIIGAATPPPPEKVVVKKKEPVKVQGTPAKTKIW